MLLSAPVLLYLFGLWAWPPSGVHLLTFALTSIIAWRFFSSRWKKVRLIIDDSGIDCGIRYPTESIVSVKPFMRAVKLRLTQENGESEATVNLAWASNRDFSEIVSRLDQQFNHSDGD